MSVSKTTMYTKTLPDLTWLSSDKGPSESLVLTTPFTKINVSKQSRFAEQD